MSEKLNINNHFLLIKKLFKKSYKLFCLLFFFGTYLAIHAGSIVKTQEKTNQIEWNLYDAKSNSDKKNWIESNELIIPRKYYLNSSRPIPKVKALGRAVTVNGYYYPEISNYIPNAFVENPEKFLTASFRGISKTRSCMGKNFSNDCSDGVLDIDFNLLNSDNFSFNPKINLQSLTSRGTDFGDGLSIGFKAATRFSDKRLFAIGGENLIHLDKTIDLGRNFYFMASTFKLLNNNEKPAILFFNAGIGSDFYGYEGNGFLAKTSCFGVPNLTGEGENYCSSGPIGSVSIAFNDRFSFNNEWFGYGYGSGVSFRPLNYSSLTLSLYATDYIKGFPSYVSEHCPDNSCNSRFYGSISVNF